MALEYDRHNASSGANSYYERPATIALLGEVSGRRVLEVGCGTGPVTEWLVEHGATVVACDVSEGWTRIARRYWAEAGLSGRIELRERKCCEFAIAAIDEVELRKPVEQRFRVPVGGKLPVAHHQASEWSVLGGERVVLDFAVVEGALLRHHQWRIG